MRLYQSLNLGRRLGAQSPTTGSQGAYYNPPPSGEGASLWRPSKRAKSKQNSVNKRKKGKK